MNAVAVPDVDNRILLSSHGSSFPTKGCDPGSRRWRRTGLAISSLPWVWVLAKDRSRIRQIETVYSVHHVLNLDSSANAALPNRTPLGRSKGCGDLLEQVARSPQGQKAMPPGIASFELPGQPPQLGHQQVQ